MQLNLEVRYLIKNPNGTNKVLCFKHAAQAAISNGEDVRVEVDERGGSCDFRDFSCEEC